MALETRNESRQRSGSEVGTSTSTEGVQRQSEANMEASQHIAGNVRERIQQPETTLNEENDERGTSSNRSVSSGCYRVYSPVAPQ